MNHFLSIIRGHFLRFAATVCLCVVQSVLSTKHAAAADFPIIGRWEVLPQVNLVLDHTNGVPYVFATGSRTITNTVHDKLYISSVSNRRVACIVDDRIDLKINGGAWETIFHLGGNPGLINITGKIPPGINALNFQAVDENPLAYYLTNTYLIQVADPGRVKDLESGGTKADSVDPINLIRGNNKLRATDLFIACPGMPLLFRRSYNSINANEGAIGQGWTHSYEWSIYETNQINGTLTNTWMALKASNGSEYWFFDKGASYASPTERNWELVLTNDKYEVTFPPDIIYTFNTNSVLETIGDSWGNTLTFSYSNSYPNNVLTNLTHDNGQYLNFQNNAGGYVTRVDTPVASFYMTFAYNTSNQLTNATRYFGNDEYVTTYEYSAFLTQRVNAAGHTFAYTYTNDGSGKAVSSMIDTNYYKHTVKYTGDGTTVVVYARGELNQTNEYRYERSSYHLTEVLGPNATTSGFPTVQYTYDVLNNVTLKTIKESAGEFLTIVSKYDDDHNVTNQAIGYNATPSDKFWQYAWDATYKVPTTITDPMTNKVLFKYTNGLVSKMQVVESTTKTNDTTFYYLSNGMVSSMTNANGHGLSYSYDANDYISAIDPEAGPTVSFENSSLGLVEKIILPGGRTNTFGVNEVGWVTNIAYANGLTETLMYDLLGNLITNIDVGGVTNTFAYLPTRKLTGSVRILGDGSALTNRVVYDQQFNGLTFRDGKDRVVEAYVLDSQDRATTITNVEGQSMTIDYGAAGIVTNVTRFDGSVVTTTYDDRGRLATATYADDTNVFSYFPNGLVESIKNLAGEINNNYDGANRLTSTKGVGTTGHVAYTYYPAGNVSNVTSAAGTYTYSIDAAERITQIATPIGDFDYTYNADNGWVETLTYSNGTKVTYLYDLVDRVTNIMWVDSQTNTLKSLGYLYSDAGMITNIVKETGETTAYEYDNMNWLTRESYRNSAGELIRDVQYAYDEVGNRTNKVVDGLNVEHTLPYGSSGNRMTNAKMTGTIRGRVDVGGFSSETLVTNLNLGHFYASNIVARTLEASGTNFWGFDLPVDPGIHDVIVAVADVAGNTSYDTNQVDMTVVTNAAYQYDTAGCITNIIYTGSNYSHTMELTWDEQYRLATVSTNGIYLESYFYDALGRLSYIDGGTGIDTNSTNVVVNGTFTNDSDWILENRWTITNGSAQYVLPPSVSGSSNIYQTCLTPGKTYNIKAQFYTYSIPFADWTLHVYLRKSGNGDMLKIKSADGSADAWVQLDFDYLVPQGYDQLLFSPERGIFPFWSVTSLVDNVEAHDLTTFTERSTNLVYDGYHVIAETMPSRELSKTYVYGPGVDNIVGMTTYGATTNTYWYIRDHVGSVLALTDKDGDIVEQYRYDAFGRVSVFDANNRPLTKSAVGNNILFQGRQYSWVTGFYYFRARWYDPITGRWLSKDPIGISGGLNQYAAFNSNPVNFVDPSGLDTDDAYGQWVAQHWKTQNDKSKAFLEGPKSIWNWVQVIGLGITDTIEFIFAPLGWPDYGWDRLAETRQEPLFEDNVVGLSLPILPVPGGGGAPLKFLHSRSSLRKSSQAFWKNQSTDDIIKSLKPGADSPLIVKPDGMIMGGNTRVRELVKRGVDVNSLPRVPR